jgi:hypothetical protein
MKIFLKVIQQKRIKATVTIDTCPSCTDNLGFNVNHIILGQAMARRE